MFLNPRYRPSAIMGRGSSSSSSVDSVLSVVLPPLLPSGQVRPRSWDSPDSESADQLVEFLACLAATSVLATGVLLLCSGVWALGAKLVLWRMAGCWRMPVCATLMVLAGALAAVLAALACLSQHGDGFWMLILSLAGVSLLLLTGGEWQALEQRASLHIVAYTARFLPLDSPLPSNLVLAPGAARDTISAVMASHLGHHSAWDSLQRMLQCCGVNNYTDWKAIKKDIPDSCCPNNDCTAGSVFQKGCVDAAALDIAATASFLCGFISVALTILTLVLLLACWRYAAENKIRLARRRRNH